MKRIEVFAYFTTVLITINSILRTKFRLGIFKLWIIIFNFEMNKVPNEDTLFLDFVPDIFLKSEINIPRTCAEFLLHLWF